MVYAWGRECRCPGKKFFLTSTKMQFKTVVIALTAASAVSAANASNGSNGSNHSNGTSSSADSGAVQVVGAGLFGAAAAAGVAMLL
ncbi:hypothetical protein E0198_002207 [Clavispora lusitaniae]|nr:hypothetical protein E0198_002207 [Clavispora lusitaniae]